jgi:integrase
MYPVSVYLARRPAQTVKVYRRALTQFSQHVNVPLDKLHEYIESPKEKIIGDLLTYADTLSNLNQNSQRLMISAVMAYLSYNEITIPKAQRQQVVPKRGDTFRDKAMTLDEVRRAYEFLPTIGRAALLLLFTTGMRIGELVQIKESDIEGQIIHVSGKYTKNHRERDVVMTNECLSFLNDIWLPQKGDYLKTAVGRNKGLLQQTKTPEKRAGKKSLHDDRIIPASQSTMYEILMRGFNRAGFGDKKDGKYLYHPHGLRKSFRSIVGSVNPDLAEMLMGHEGYLSQNYVRLDLIKEYQKVEDLLSLSGNAGMASRLQVMEKENEALWENIHALELGLSGALSRLSGKE